MKMKPCTIEQDILFAIHGEGSLWQKVRVAIHCLYCESCRIRRQEFLMTARALMSLRPVPAMGSPIAYRPSRRGRLILCSALVALAAAAVSYYAAFGPPKFGGEPCRPNAASTGAAKGCHDDGKTQAPTTPDLIAKTPSAQKPGDALADNAPKTVDKGNTNP